MKLTKEQVTRIINEELDKFMDESPLEAAVKIATHTKDTVTRLSEGTDVDPKELLAAIADLLKDD